MKPDPWSLARKAAARLRAAKIEPADLLAEWLVAERMGCRRMDLPFLKGQSLADEKTAWFDDDLARLETGEPLAYVLGYADFRGRRIALDARALVPRPETEQLVELIMKCNDLWRMPEPRVADVGAGSGCIAITLALEQPAARILAIDIEQTALALARENAERWSVQNRIEFLCNDLMQGLAEASLDAVVANLPYIAEHEINTLDCSVRAFEPHAALDGGSDGLVLIRRLVAQAVKILRPGGRLFLEIGATQGQAVQALLKDRNYSNINVLPDYAGLSRFAVAAIPNAVPTS